MLTKVLEINGDIKKILITQKNEEKDGEKTKKKEPTKPENDERVLKNYKLHLTPISID